jgi:hypothetical protein
MEKEREERFAALGETMVGSVSFASGSGSHLELPVREIRIQSYRYHSTSRSNDPLHGGE